jgi:RNA recognition motif-containing protein
MDIFIGNLSFEADEADVYKIFIKFGVVTFISIVKEKKGVKSRGFGFIEMPDEEQAKAAITALNGKEFMGRALNVACATSKVSPLGARKKQYPKSEGYKSGRRTRSFMRRATVESPEYPAPWKSKSWRKNQVQSKPWRRIEGQPKPWQRTEEAVKKHSRSLLEIKNKNGDYKR